MDKAIREGRLNEVKEILYKGDYNVNEVSKVASGLVHNKNLITHDQYNSITCRGSSLLCNRGSAMWLLSPISVLEIS